MKKFSLAEDQTGIARPTLIGYPDEGLYILLVDGDRIIAGEKERTPGSLPVQAAALHRYYPSGARKVKAILGADGVFTATDNNYL